MSLRASSLISIESAQSFQGLEAVWVDSDPAVTLPVVYIPACHHLPWHSPTLAMLKDHPLTKDTRLRQQILDELEFDPQVTSEHIGVAVDDGIVTLTGHAASFSEKRATEAAARRVKGVRGIAENVTVVLPEAHRRDDEELARQALCMVEWNMTIPKDAIQVTVENGWVTLSGDVDSYFVGRSAQKAVEKMSGVRGVTNLINRRQPVMPQDVAERIRRVLDRRDIHEPNQINVTAFGGKVTLEGRVRGLIERKLVERAAWGTEGVTYVDNHLVVSDTPPESMVSADKAWT